MACHARIYPMQQPNGWKPKVPRWTLQLPESVKKIAVAYLGIQIHDDNPITLEAKDKAAQAVDDWLHDDARGDAPLLFEKLEVVNGFDVPGSLVWVCYWTTLQHPVQSLDRLNLKNICLSTGGGSSLGMWRESYIAEPEFFETNYSGDDYRPGFAGLFGQSDQKLHDLTGYWGAARDRIPASAYEKFERSDGDKTTPNFEKDSLDRHLMGSNIDTICHIRSGQFWANSSPEEVEAYETKLEPALMNGLDYLEKNPQESGDFGLRFLRNVSKTKDQHDQTPRKETCGAGFFRNLADLERWAKSHPSHHKIYNGAIKHRNEFADNYNLRTWHEVSILKPGGAFFDYVNCTNRTGMIPFQELNITA